MARKCRLRDSQQGVSVLKKTTMSRLKIFQISEKATQIWRASLISKGPSSILTVWRCGWRAFSTE
jgi:hypothetical protein